MSRAVRLGVFIVATLAILVAGVFIIGSQQDLFSSTYKLRAQFANVAGLAAGADVRVGGVHSGTVREIQLPHKPGDKVTVVMDVMKSTHEILKQDSIATIETEGLLGSQFMAISFGSAGAGEVRDGDVVHTEAPLEMSDLLKQAGGILNSSQAAMQNVTVATANLNSISAKINTGQGTVGALVNDKALYNNLQQTTATLQGTMVQANAGVTDFRENMEAMKHNILLRGYFTKRGYEDSADLSAHAIEHAPAGTPMKSFSYPAKKIFDKSDSAKLKNQKELKAAGEYLAANPFGIAVVVASGSGVGDSQAQRTLTQARAMVVRDYLVANFDFDDTQMKTLGAGKESVGKADGGWGEIEILIYPDGTPEPPAAVESVPGAVSEKHVEKRIDPNTALKPQ